MDLREFVTETISAIVDATTELQKKYSKEGILINPPSAQTGNDVYAPGSENYTLRRVQQIAFDVAVTAASANDAKGKAGIRVLSFEVGAEAGKASSAENVSRVSFSVPITLKPTEDEATNQTVKKKGEDRMREATNNRKPSRVVV